MKNGFTKFRIVFPLSFFVALVLLPACSSNESIKIKDSSTVDKVFLFKDGNDNYRVEFEGDKIARIFKNEEVIPESQIDNYKELVNYELRNLAKDLSEKKSRQSRIKIFFDNDKTDKDTTHPEDEDFIEPEIFQFRFDDRLLRDLRTEIDSMIKDLKDKNFDVYIDPDDFTIQMKKFKKYFKDFNPPEPPGFDREKFREQMKKFREEMKKLDSLNIDLKDMFRELREKRKRNIEIIEIGKNSSQKWKSSSFINDLKEELARDGFLDSFDTELKFKMNNEEIIVNGKEIPDYLKSKYRELFNKHLGRKL